MSIRGLDSVYSDYTMTRAQYFAAEPVPEPVRRPRPEPAPPLRTLLERPEWFSQAECRGMDVSLFFPTRGGATTEARKVCLRCAVRAECLAYGMGERFGIFGGVSERGRRRLRKGRAA